MREMMCGRASQIIYNVTCVGRVEAPGRGPGIMNSEWERMKSEVSQCKPLDFDKDTYGQKIWPIIEQTATKGASSKAALSSA